VAGAGVAARDAAAGGAGSDNAARAAAALATRGVSDASVCVPEVPGRNASIRNIAISNPAREILFTVLAREEKYKAKNVIDIVVFRGADAVFGWLFAALRGAGLELPWISLATVPVMLVWLILALGLGRTQERRARSLPTLQPDPKGA